MRKGRRLPAAPPLCPLLSGAPEAGLTGESGGRFPFSAQAAQAAPDELKPQEKTPPARQVFIRQLQPRQFALLWL